jgi:DNA primase
VLIREQELDVDILEELENFDWSNQVIKGNKFICCSPFRTERHASFAVNLESGLFIDSGNSDEYLHKGNLIKLLATLRNEEYEAIEDYLIEKYSTILADTDTLKLDMNLLLTPSKPLCINMENIQHLYTEKTDYFTGRGISLEVQKMFALGFNPKDGTVAMPWMDNKGNIINIKYRQIKQKAFFYEVGGQQIKEHVYGIYQCIQLKAKRVYVCESEIDALTLWTYNIPAIAVGGSSLSSNQKQIILNSGIEEFVIATDNDLVGNRFRRFLKSELGGNLILFSFAFPPNVKDVNDMNREQINNSVRNLISPTYTFLRPM